MPIFVALFLGAVMMMTSLSFVGWREPERPALEKEVYNRARGTFYATGTEPSTVTYLNRNFSTDSFNFTAGASMESWHRTWKKRTRAEQAIVNVCVTLQAMCNEYDITRLWAFMPNSTGQISTQILGGTSQASITCSTATTTEYAQYGRHLMKTVLATADVSSEVINGTTRNLFYNKPGSGEGCGFQDLVEFR